MRSRRWQQAVLLAGLLLAASAARAQSPQEKKRNDILRDLGLKKKPPAPPAGSGSAAPGPGATRRRMAPTRPRARRASPPARTRAAPLERARRRRGLPRLRSGRVVFPLFVTTCKPCHSPGLPGGASHLLLSGDAAADHKVIVRFVNTRDAEASALLGKVSGATMHAGGAPWPATGAQYQRVLAWIRGGARLDAAARAEPVAEAAAPHVPPPAPRKPPAASATGTAPAGPAAAPPSPGAPAAAAPPAAAETPTPPITTAPPTAAPPARSSAPSFAASVHPVLTGACAICHRPGGPAAMSRLVLSGDAAGDEAIVRAFIDTQAPEQSLLVTKSRGEMHAGGAVLAPGDPRLDAIVTWAKALTAPQAPAAAPAPAGAAIVPAAPGAPSVAPSPAGTFAGRASPHGHGGPGGPGFALPFGFMLNGRFSLDYERRQFSGDPFEASSVNALRSYHHFLFLSHDTAADPCGLSVEVLTLQFWEAHCRVPHLPAPVRLTVAGGKIVVPFGADPLYHQSYGGLAGSTSRSCP